MRFFVFGLVALGVVAPCAQAIKLINEDDNNWCVLIEIRHGELGYGLCAPEAEDLSQGAVAGDDITMWAEWDTSNKDICGWSAGSVTFKMPPGGGDFVWKNDCLEQSGAIDVYLSIFPVVYKSILLEPRTSPYPVQTKRGVLVDDADINNLTPLMIAVTANKRLDAVDALVSDGADLLATQNKGWTLLDLAINEELEEASIMRLAISQLLPGY
ncbi:MAG: hypothetical protein Q9180_005970 [Flavoplaca navasiana]